MILITDTSYTDQAALTSGVILDDWLQSTPSRTVRFKSETPASYVSGQFYKRELPCILGLLQDYDLKPDTIIVDGYVYLDGKSSPGLGAYLCEALGEKVKIIGVAKNRYRNIDEHHAILRGSSKNPLWVTCAGLDIDLAKDLIKNMYGDFRLPDMIKLADQLTRG